MCEDGCFIDDDVLGNDIFEEHFNPWSLDDSQGGKLSDWASRYHVLVRWRLWRYSELRGV